MKRRPVTILDAFDDANLFGGALRDASTWWPWRALLAALFGLPMTKKEAARFRRGHLVRATLPGKAFTEAWLICGRRAGKYLVLALIAVFLACFTPWQPYLAIGERAMILVIATDRKQARVIFRYVKALLSIPLLAQLCERGVTETIDLTNGVSIEIAVASYRTTRGYTLAAVLADELAFWHSEGSAEPDYEILDALRPGLGTLPGAMLLCASSPYAQRGALHDAFRRYHGRDDSPVLVWRAATRTINPTFPQATIDAAMERDAASASAEYGAIFRSDVQNFAAPEAVEAIIARGIFERAPIGGVQYAGFVDPSGGASDAMTMAIAHQEKGIAIFDCVRSRKPPFSPDNVVAEFAGVLRSYGISRIRGDYYGGEWPAERFRAHGIAYERAEKAKSEIYLAALPLINSQRCELLDNRT